MPVISQRLVLILVGVFASSIAFICQLTGFFHLWDLGIFRWLAQADPTRSVPVWFELVCIVLFAFGAAFVQMEISLSRMRNFLFGTALLQPISAVAGGVLVGCLVSPFPWLLAILLPIAAGYFYRRTLSGLRQRQVREVFSDHVSAVTLQKLLAQPETDFATSAKGTVLNARLLQPKDGEMEAVAERLRQSGAWVELQIGGHLVAVWNVIVPVPAAAQTAVNATLPLGENWQIGVASGEISREFSPDKAWQMRGSALERAAALAVANATFGSRTLIDLPTADALGETMILRPVDLMAEPGADLRTEVYEPLALSQSADSRVIEQRDAFWKALILFRQRRFSEALSSFAEAGNDPVVRRYIERLENTISAPSSGAH